MAQRQLTVLDDHAIKPNPTQDGRNHSDIRGPLRVRPLELPDIPEAVALGAQMHAEGAFAHLPYSEQKVYAIAERAIDHNEMCGLIAEEQGELIGAMLGVINTYFFCHEGFAQDLMLFVRKDKRTSPRIAVKLVKAFEDWAREHHNVREIRLGTTTGHRPEQVAKFYEALGFARVGTLHVKRT